MHTPTPVIFRPCGFQVVFHQSALTFAMECDRMWADMVEFTFQTLDPGYFCFNIFSAILLIPKWHLINFKTVLFFPFYNKSYAYFCCNVFYSGTRHSIIMLCIQYRYWDLFCVPMDYFKAMHKTRRGYITYTFSLHTQKACSTSIKGMRQHSKEDAHF